MWPQIYQVTSLSLSFPTLQGFVSIKHIHTDKKPRAQQGLTKRYPPSQVPATSVLSLQGDTHCFKESPCFQKEMSPRGQDRKPDTAHANIRVKTLKNRYDENKSR